MFKNSAERSSDSNKTYTARPSDQQMMIEQLLKVRRYHELIDHFSKKFEIIDKFMPLVGETIHELKSVEKRIYVNSARQFKEMKRARKAVRKRLKKDSPM